MTLEEKLYIFIKGLKTNIQISVAMEDPTTVEQAKILAASADGFLSQQRRTPPTGLFVSHESPFVARPEPMEIGAVAQRRNRLDPDEFETGRAGRLCYVWQGGTLCVRARCRWFPTGGKLVPLYPSRCFKPRMGSKRDGARNGADYK
jgi:hypothetical protein